MQNKKNDKEKQGPADTPVVKSGNASNPSPEAGEEQGSQLLDKKAEKYLREGGNIEDMPDAQDEEDAAKKNRQ